MADLSEALGTDTDILAGRLKFLSARAQWHLKQSDGSGRVVPGSRVMHLACAATLRRDAGAIALLLGRAEHARSEFMASGSLRLALGFYDGLYLLRLGEAGSRDGRTVLGDATAWLEQSLQGGERERGPQPPFAAAASRSPRQLVSVLQAADTVNTPLEGAARLAFERLQVYGAYPLGVTQTPIERYLKLFYELRDGALGDGRRTLIAMSIQREELITTAQRDRFHWRLAQKPASGIMPTRGVDGTTASADCALYSCRALRGQLRTSGGSLLTSDLGRQHGLAPVQELAMPPCPLCGRMAMSAMPSTRDALQLAVAADQPR